MSKDLWKDTFREYDSVCPEWRLFESSIMKQIRHDIEREFRMNPVSEISFEEETRIPPPRILVATHAGYRTYPLLYENLAAKLREAGWHTDIYLLSRTLGRQFSFAYTNRYTLLVYLPPQSVAPGVVAVRHLSSGKALVFSESTFVREIAALLAE